jgi:CopG family transcriptional regulator, nickel-responsive regulator
MKTEGVTRISVSLPAGLLRQLDRMAKDKGYDNRSLAVANMIRDHLVEHQRRVGTQEIAGTITLVYDHHKPHLLEALTDMQHDHGEQIISTLHVHLDHHNCLEVLVVRGEAAAIQAMADRLIGLKGVKHGKLSLTTTGKHL